jgi:hypothetical protein
VSAVKWLAEREPYNVLCIMRTPSEEKNLLRRLC